MSYCIGDIFEGPYEVKFHKEIREKQLSKLDGFPYSLMPKFIGKEIVLRNLNELFRESDAAKELTEAGIIRYHLYNVDWPTSVHVEAESLPEALQKIKENEDLIKKYLGWTLKDIEKVVPTAYKISKPKENERNWDILSVKGQSKKTFAQLVLG